MTHTRRILAGLSCLLMAIQVSAGEFTPVEKKMTPEQMKAAGLDKLSSSELSYLNDWLDGKIDEAVEAEIKKDEKNWLGFNKSKNERDNIELTIDGEFKGWSGNTLFRMTNGQVWKQIGEGSYRYNADSPKVRMEPKSLGSWKMYVEGVSRGVKVKRIK